MAASMVEALASEVATMARAARRHLSGDRPWTLVLGGGLFTDREGRFLTAIRTAAPGLEEEFRVTIANAPPVAGAALLGLDYVGEAPDGETVTSAFRAATPIPAYIAP